MEIALNLVQTSMEATPAHANSVITLMQITVLAMVGEILMKHFL